MIVGLKYAGASDGFPTRISVGDTVSLRLEGAQVTAYHNDRKVGYLSPDKRRLWDSLRHSSRARARVVGEILDEEGSIAGLDVEFSAPPKRVPPSARRSQTSAREQPGIDSDSRPYRAVLGLAVLLSSIAVMGHASSTGPDRLAAAQMTIGETAPPLSGSASLVPSKPLHEAPLLDPDRELRRQVQMTSVHRLADAIRRREAAAQLKLEAEERKVRALEDALKQVRQASAQQLKRIEELEKQGRTAAVERQAERLRHGGEIASLQQKIELLDGKKREVEQGEKQAAWRHMNDQELVRHRNRLSAWMVMSRVEHLKSALKNRVTLERAKAAERAVSVSEPEKKQQAEKNTPPEKSSRQAEEVQIKKKANFSRYAQENEEPIGPANR
jgi:hypothetical protein